MALGHLQRVLLGDLIRYHDRLHWGRWQKNLWEEPGNLLHDKAGRAWNWQAKEKIRPVGTLL